MRSSSSSTYAEARTYCPGYPHGRLSVVKHRQLVCQVGAFGEFVSESSTNLKIKIRCGTRRPSLTTRCGSHRPSSMTRQVNISVTCGDSVSHGSVRRRPSASLQPDLASGVQEQTKGSPVQVQGRVEVQIGSSIPCFGESPSQSRCSNKQKLRATVPHVDQDGAEIITERFQIPI